MMTAREYAKNATAVLHHILDIPADDFDDDGTAAVIEQAIRDATRERDSRVGQQLEEAAGGGAAAFGAAAEFVTCSDLQLQGDR